MYQIDITHSGKHTKNGPLELFQKKTVSTQISKMTKEVIFSKKVFCSKLSKLRNPKVVIIIARKLSKKCFTK